MASSQKDWQSTKNTLQERGRHMFNNPFMSDIAFTCEGSKKKFLAHKYVLVTSSVVFNAMFNGKFAEKNSVVQLNDTNVESLREFLRFLYTEECELTTDNAVFVLYLAKKYIVPSLSWKCIKFLEANIEVENVFTVLQQAIHFDEKSLENKCWDLIDLNTSAAVASDVFTDINQATLVQFLKRETLKIREVDLFPAVLEWSEAECLRKGIEGNGKNKRNVLGNAIYEIRFVSMTAREFAQCTSDSGLLTSDEMVSFYEKLSGIEKAFEGWNMSERRASEKERTLQRCRRFTRYDVFDTNLMYHAIRVTFSKPVKIHGVEMLSAGPCQVSLQIRSQSVQKTVNQKWNRWQITKFDVMLPVPVKVEAKVPVHIEATVNGPNFWYGGINGKEIINVDGITVKFSDLPENGTTVKHGQFDAIIFSEF